MHYNIDNFMNLKQTLLAELLNNYNTSEQVFDAGNKLFIIIGNEGNLFNIKSYDIVDISRIDMTNFSKLVSQLLCNFILLQI